ncbi:hypothetical protein O181_012212 [Austropuccinia psidii MF-1]|uniref:Retroviral polymerase SH3-like domain-containing protein n=1 Tax=Austropuccinia psidii MF-1 TaxID=1389203 RepID=A0A9Q3GMT3_9BASI|nr:hypothetical protein [Austropuccinia psidii MF-1]
MSRKGIFLGYYPNTNKWWIILENGKIIKSHDVVFDENVFIGPPEGENTNSNSTQYRDYDIVTKLIENEYTNQIELSHYSENCNSEDIGVSNKSFPNILLTKTGWDYKLTLNQAPEHVSAKIDELKILSSNRRENAAITSSYKNKTTWEEKISLLDRPLWVEALKN